MLNAMVKEGLSEEKRQEKLNKYHRPENCESLTKVRVNQSLWDHLTPTVRLQKVHTSLFKRMCALTIMIDKFPDHIPSPPQGNDLLQQVNEVNRVGKKVSTHSGRSTPEPDLSQACRRSTAKPDYHRHNFYTRGHGRPGHQYYRKPFLGSWKNDHKRPQTFKQKKEKSKWIRFLTMLMLR